MSYPTNPLRRVLHAAILVSSLGLAGTTALPSLAQEAAVFPQIRMTYRDLALDTVSGQRALVERVQTTSEIHCAKYGALIVPYERRFQPRFCINAVRSEILSAMPRPIRSAYDLGRTSRQ
jgi:UrcA family protein